MGITLEQSRKHRETKVAKYGLEYLNRKNALQRARRKGVITPQTKHKYQFTDVEIEGLRVCDLRANCDEQDYIYPTYSI